jgi:large subunit ribosomal protein L3
MKFLITKKIEMSQVFDESGRVIPVTLLEAEPNVVTLIRTKEKDGYEAVQLGAFQKKDGTFKWKREARGNINSLKVGDIVDASIFKPGDKVDVIGYSKGRGFQGVVKRHGFGGAPKTHGTKHAHREPGSIGPTHPQHVIKGRRMAGHMGNERVTIKNLTVVNVDPVKKIIALKGAVPGARGSIVLLRGKNN